MTRSKNAMQETLDLVATERDDLKKQLDKERADRQAVEELLKSQIAVFQKKCAEEKEAKLAWQAEYTRLLRLTEYLKEARRRAEDKLRRAT